LKEEENAKACFFTALGLCCLALQGPQQLT